MQIINHIYKSVYNSVVNYNAWKGFGLMIQIGYVLEREYLNHYFENEIKKIILYGA